MPKNVKCVSLKFKRYLIDTDDILEALEVATELLKKEKHFDLYSVLPVILVDVHDIEGDR